MFQIPVDVIVIGASLGGLQAISSILAALPETLQASILVVLHSGPSSPRVLDEIFSSRTGLNVSYATENAPLQRRHVYVAPPDKHLEVMASRLSSIRQGHRQRRYHHQPATS